MKKIISLILAVFVLTAMFSFEAFADSSSVTVYNAPNGIATINTPASDDVLNKYEAIMRYLDGEHLTSNANQSGEGGSSGKIFTKVGYETNGNFVTYWRFPLSAIVVPEGKEISSVNLYVTSAKAYTNFASSPKVLGAYTNFTTTPLGEIISYSPLTYEQLTAPSNCVGSVTLNRNISQYEALSIDVTDYVKTLKTDGAASADFALTIPGAETQFQIYTVHNVFSKGANLPRKPHLVVEFEDSADAFPSIDTVANEGKTKIRMQTQDEVPYSNTTAGLLFGNNKNVTYTVNCKTAGTYYLTVYTAAVEYNGSRDGTLSVNGGTANTISFNNSKTVNTNDPADIRKSLRANVIEVNLTAGVNTLTLKSSSSYLGFGFVELTNYERAGSGSVHNISEKGIEFAATEQPSNTVHPTVVYKVYDSIEEAASAGLTTVNLTAQISNPFDSTLENINLIVAKYNGDKRLEDCEIIPVPSLSIYTQTNFDLGEFTLADADKFRFFVWKSDGSIVPMTESVYID